MDKGQKIDPKLVEEFVGVSHGNLDRVKQILEQESAIVNAAWDWGGGDWETGLGAAAHVGRQDIANLLLAHGARLDLFAAAMLGRLDIVTAVITAYPDMKNALGPHGIPLIAHAKAGGEAAAAVLQYLEAL
jgi:hypothetical protein